MKGENIYKVLESGSIEKAKLANLISYYQESEVYDQDLLERLVSSCYLSKEFDECLRQYNLTIDAFNRDSMANQESNREYYKTCRINSMFMGAIYLSGGYTLTCVNASALDGLGKFVLTAGIIGLSMVAQKKTNNYKNSNPIREEFKKSERTAYEFKDRMITDYMLMSNNYNYCSKRIMEISKLEEIKLLIDNGNSDEIINEFYNQHLVQLVNHILFP
mgnify:CR=1 FL=1